PLSPASLPLRRSPLTRSPSAMIRTATHFSPKYRAIRRPRLSTSRARSRSPGTAIATFPLSTPPFSAAASKEVRKVSKEVRRRELDPRRETRTQLVVVDLGEVSQGDGQDCPSPRTNAPEAG